MPQPAGTPAVTDQQISALLCGLRAVPDTARRFSVPMRAARTRFGVSSDMLRRLLDAGLPARRRSGTLLFDRHDLMNTSMQLATGALARLSGSSWAAALDPRPGPVGARILTYTATCPASATAHPCRFLLALPGEERHEASLSDGRGLRFATAVQPRVDWPEAPQLLRPVLADMAGLRFMRLPPVLQGDLGFVAKHGIADCLGTALLLVERASALDLRARLSYGLMTVAPYANVHYWAEVWHEDMWVPYDPVLVTSLLSREVLNPVRWNVNRSVGTGVARVGTGRLPLAVHDGTEVAVSVSVGRSPQPAEPRHHSERTEGHEQ